MAPRSVVNIKADNIKADFQGRIGSIGFQPPIVWTAQCADDLCYCLNITKREPKENNNTPFAKQTQSSRLTCSIHPNDIPFPPL